MWKKSDLVFCAKPPAVRGFMVSLVLVAAAWAQSGQNLPDGKGKAQFTRVCGQCHGVEIVIKKTNSGDGWADVVDDMVSRGAQGTADDFDLVVTYLAAHFGPKVYVNKADANELSTVLEVSAADAEAIVHYRETTGSFKDWSDLEKVPHIDLKKLEQEKNRIDFSTGQGPSEEKK
jgi:competence ComEA-like helix-hairpin-helix protein